jgi:23S rRNA (guanosine2251-2'-O)-methyltransferase
MTANEHLVAGKQAVLETLQRHPEQVDSVLIQKTRKRDTPYIFKICQDLKIKYVQVPKQTLDGLTTAAHQGVVARIFSPGFIDSDQLLERLADAAMPLVLGLDHVQDAGNVGTLARTLYALGGAGLMVTKDRSAFLGDRAHKAAAGALSSLPVCRTTNLARTITRWTRAGCTVYHASVGPETQSVYQSAIRWPAMLVLGGEDQGVRPNVARKCDCGLHIPQASDFDSLNVAQAGAMLVGEFLRQWRGGIAG